MLHSEVVSLRGLLAKWWCQICFFSCYSFFLMTDGRMDTLWDLSTPSPHPGCPKHSLFTCEILQMAIEIRGLKWSVAHMLVDAAIPNNLAPSLISTFETDNMQLHEMVTVIKSSNEGLEQGTKLVLRFPLQQDPFHSFFTAWKIWK